MKPRRSPIPCRSNRIEHTAVKDSEIETEEFLALFPDYDDAFEKTASGAGTNNSISTVESSS